MTVYSPTRNLKGRLNNIYQRYIEDTQELALFDRSLIKDSLIEYSEKDIIQLYAIQNIIRPLYGKGLPQVPDFGDHPDFKYLKGTDEEVYCSISTLFMDIEGSTRLGLFYTLSDVKRIKNAFIRAAIELIKCFDGHIHRIMGDAVMAYFGGKFIKAETGAINSLNCASLLRYFVECVVQPGLKSWGYEEDFGIRIGLDFGSDENVLWSSYGYPGMAEVTATSFYVDVAAKLQQSAGKNQIMLGNSLQTFLDIPQEILTLKKVIEQSQEIIKPFVTPNYITKEGLSLNYQQYILNWEKYLKFSPLAQQDDTLLFEQQKLKGLSVSIEVYGEHQDYMCKYYSCSDILQKNKRVKFIVDTRTLLHLRPYILRFIVKNHGLEALEQAGDSSGNHSTDYKIDSNNSCTFKEHWESTLYKGLHYMRIELHTHKGLYGLSQLGIYVE